MSFRLGGGKGKKGGKRKRGLVREAVWEDDEEGGDGAAAGLHGREGGADRAGRWQAVHEGRLVSGTEWASAVQELGEEAARAAEAGRFAEALGLWDRQLQLFPVSRLALGQTGASLSTADAMEEETASDTTNRRHGASSSSNSSSRGGGGGGGSGGVVVDATLRTQWESAAEAMGGMAEAVTTVGKTWEMKAQAQGQLERDWEAVQCAEEAVRWLPAWDVARLTLARAQLNFREPKLAMGNLALLPALRCLDSLEDADPPLSAGTLLDPSGRPFQLMDFSFAGALPHLSEEEVSAIDADEVACAEDLLRQWELIEHNAERPEPTHQSPSSHHDAGRTDGSNVMEKMTRKRDAAMEEDEEEGGEEAEDGDDGVVPDGHDPDDVSLVDCLKHR